MPSVRFTEIPGSTMARAARVELMLCSVLMLGITLAGTPAFALAPARAFHASSKDHSHGYLGIEFHDTSDEQIAAMHLQGPRGAEIIMVDHDGPAGKAGLQPHDVVLQVDGQSIDTADDLSRRIRESTPGRVLSLSIVRLGRALTLTAKLADPKELERNTWQKPEPPPPGPDDGVENVLIQRYAVETTPAPTPRTPSHTQNFIGTVLRTGPYTGASLETMEPQLAGFFGAPV
jgi:serine protease Do